jgi:hypothetical protein
MLFYTCDFTYSQHYIHLPLFLAFVDNLRVYHDLSLKSTCDCDFILIFERTETFTKISVVLVRNYMYS